MSIERAFSITPAGEAPPQGMDVSAPDVQSTWPTMDISSIYGLAGDIVRAFDPVTEADPAAVLITLLIVVGSALNRGAHVMVSETRHALNLFAVLVGMSSKARKGTSLNLIRSLMRSVDDVWAMHCVTSGLSSGEGLIYNVRDPVIAQKRIHVRGESDRYERVETDAGIADRRLLVVEEEYASALRVMGRDGSTLSAIIRQAWDGAEVLRSMTKNSPNTATRAHISILGHVTTTELRRELAETEKANGFANRFLFVCARRSKLLPDGGVLDAEVKRELRARLSTVLAFAGQTGELHRSRDASDLWREKYATLSAGGESMVDALTARGEAQTVRLAALFAVLDCSSIVERWHLEAALNLWRYCEASARAVFGESIGQGHADSVLARLRADGPLTRERLRAAFSNHVSAGELDDALRTLAASGRALARVESTGGRPRTTWEAA